MLDETLRHIAAAVTAFTKAGWEYELIVCDNNSTDGTADIACKAGATVVFEPINQIARARNRGAAAATGEWLLFVDADSHPDAELLADVVVAIQSGRYVAGGSTVRLDEGGGTAAKLVTASWNFISRWRRLLAGSFIFCETAAFKKIGGFSNELFAAEELELAQRLKVYAAWNKRELVILHRHPMLTSSRKVRLYTWREHLRFTFRAVFNHQKTIRDRDACHAWYDGRR